MKPVVHLRTRARRTRVILLAAALAGVVLVAACGQTGPLYLPNPDAPNQGRPK